MQFERASRCVVSWCILALGAVACSSNAGTLCGPGTVPRAGGCELAPEHPLPFRVCGAGTRLDGNQCVPAGGAPNGGGDASAPGTADASMPASGDASADRGDPVEVDLVAPVFGGVLGAKSNSDSSVRLSWDPARDDRTPEAALVYRVFVSKTAGGEDFSAPALVTAPGATSVVVGGLEHAPTRYFFVVRAQDASGNMDANAQEITAMAGYDQTAPAFAGCDTVLEASSSTIVVTWNAATDNLTPDNLIEYRIWMADSADAARAHSRAADQAISGQTKMTFSSMPRGHRYYFHCEAVDADGNSDGNVATTDILFDLPPTFADQSLTFPNIGTTSVDIVWPAALDDATPPQSLVYEIQLGAGAGRFTKETAPGSTTVTFDGLEPATSYTVFVHARDHSGQLDTSGPEGNFTTLVSFAMNIQPRFTANCAIAGCHDVVTAAADLVLAEGLSYGNLINVKATQPALYGPSDWLRVVPLRVSDSALYQKLGGREPGFYGSQMPPGAFDNELLNHVPLWITEGALDN